MDELGVPQRASLELLAQPEALGVGQGDAVQPQLGWEIAHRIRQQAHAAPVRTGVRYLAAAAGGTHAARGGVGEQRG